MKSLDIEAYLRDVFGSEAELVAVEPLGVEDHDTGISNLLRLTMRTGDGEQRLVLRRATPTVYSTERFADRAREILQAREVYDRIPNHPCAFDVAVIGPDGRLRRLPADGEFALLHAFAEGTGYAPDLFRCLQSSTPSARDLERAAAAGAYLARLHVERDQDPRAYRRAMRDFVAGGTGVMGVIGGFAQDVRETFHDRLRDILRDFIALAWEIEQKPGPLCRIHGDFHPLNILFDDGAGISVIDASGTGWGDPAFDVGTMYANYHVLANEPGGLGTAVGRRLAERFLDAYLAADIDLDALYRVLPLSLARSVLIMATTAFFPQRSMDERGRLIRLAGDILSAGTFDPGLFTP